MMVVSDEGRGISAAERDLLFAIIEGREASRPRDWMEVIFGADRVVAAIKAGLIEPWERRFHDRRRKPERRVTLSPLGAFAARPPGVTGELGGFVLAERLVMRGLEMHVEPYWMDANEYEEAGPAEILPALPWEVPLPFPGRVRDDTIRERYADADGSLAAAAKPKKAKKAEAATLPAVKTRKEKRAERFATRRAG